MNKKKKINKYKIFKKIKKLQMNQKKVVRCLNFIFITFVYVRNNQISDFYETFYNA